MEISLEKALNASEGFTNCCLLIDGESVSAFNRMGASVYENMECRHEVYSVAGSYKASMIRLGQRHSLPHTRIHTISGRAALWAEHWVNDLPALCEALRKDLTPTRGTSRLQFMGHPTQSRQVHVLFMSSLQARCLQPASSTQNDPHQESSFVPWHFTIHLTHLKTLSDRRNACRRLKKSLSA